MIFKILSFLFDEMEKIEKNEAVYDIIASPKCAEVVALLSLKKEK